MGVISDSINQLSKGHGGGGDTIVLPLGEVSRTVPLDITGDRLEAHIDSYNRETKVMALSWTDGKGKGHVVEVELHMATEEEVGDGAEKCDDEIPLFTVSGKLVYLAVPRPA